MRIAHVTLYPPKGEKHISGSGVASYSKNLVTQLARYQIDQTVICNSIDDNDAYEEDGVSVRRVFKRNPSFLLSVHKELKRTDPDVIHIQQELALFGNVITACLLQLLVLVWHRKTVITLHGVADPKIINKTFVKENNSGLPVWIVKLAFRIIYTPLMKWSRRVIVHEHYFKDIAEKSYGITPDKITVVPHGVEALETLEKAEARAALSIPRMKEVALFMGYATGYKGLDLLIDGFALHARNNPKAYLIIGAGKHPKLYNNDRYLTEYARLQEKAAQLIPKNQYRWEGFIKESEITVYYSASDLSLYPYTAAISSSGPMSFAIGYEKPFLVSTAFQDIFNEYPQLLFKRNPRSLAEKLTYFFSHQGEYETTSRTLKRQRNWVSVSDRTRQIYVSIENQGGAYESEKSTTTG